MTVLLPLLSTHRVVNRGMGSVYEGWALALEGTETGAM
ncbi:hypothetical protein F383_30198 [Gossypium arboreum]|uniref:Uncharacterized protein n=1 Tax=Gossypium arboreum TaxID=29729 RepID=A0A0B0N0L8_GOSAR|nr:hypothetical protein F383_30198 [Gossypium arboreum]